MAIVILTTIYCTNLFTALNSSSDIDIISFMNRISYEINFPEARRDITKCESRFSFSYFSSRRFTPEPPTVMFNPSGYKEFSRAIATLSNVST